MIAEFDDGLGTATSPDDWRVYTVTFGPTDASLKSGCAAGNLGACEVEDRGTPKGWNGGSFDDSEWNRATVYSAAAAGWGRPPRWSGAEGSCGLTSPADRSGLGCDPTVAQHECLSPRTEFADNPAVFLWAADLERDNRVLFRHTSRCSP